MAQKRVLFLGRKFCPAATATLPATINLQKPWASQNIFEMEHQQQQAVCVDISRVNIRQLPLLTSAALA